MSILEFINSDQMQVVLLLLVQYPICFVLSFIKHPFAKMIYIITFGMLLMIYFFGNVTFFILLQPLVSYILMHVLPSKLNCLITFLFGIASLSYVHYLRLFWEEGKWIIDCDLPAMINTLKISSIPFLIYDGKKDEKDLKYEQNKFKLDRKPSFLEYFRYILFIPTAIIGPYFEYKVHHNYINSLEDFDTKIQKPSKWPSVLNKTKKAFIYVLVYILCQKSFSYEVFFVERSISWTEIVSLCLSFTIIFRYLIGWMFTEAHFAICGISYDDAEKNYEGIKIINDYEIVFNPNPSTIFNVSLYL